MHHFSLAALKFVFFVFSFQKFYYDVSWPGFLRVCSAWICRFMFFCQIWEIFSPYFFEWFFQPYPLFFFWDSDDTNVRTFVIVPHIPEALFIVFPPLFSLCCSDWLNDIVSSSSSLILSSVSPTFCSWAHSFSIFCFQF